VAILFKFPKEEATKCLVFAQTLPQFLNMMTKNLNFFVMTRATEFYKYSEQFGLVSEFLHFFSKVITYCKDEKLSELYHAYAVEFMPQTIFFLAQHVSMNEQDRDE